MRCSAIHSSFWVIVSRGLTLRGETDFDFAGCSEEHFAEGEDFFVFIGVVEGQGTAPARAVPPSSNDDCRG